MARFSKFLFGGIVGAGVALLFAPKPGRELRRMLMGGGRPALPPPEEPLLKRSSGAGSQVNLESRLEETKRQVETQLAAAPAPSGESAPEQPGAAIAAEPPLEEAAEKEAAAGLAAKTVAGEETGAAPAAEEKTEPPATEPAAAATGGEQAAPFSGTAEPAPPLHAAALELEAEATLVAEDYVVEETPPETVKETEAASQEAELLEIKKSPAEAETAEEQAGAEAQAAGAPVLEEPAEAEPAEAVPAGTMGEAAIEPEAGPAREEFPAEELESALAEEELAAAQQEAATGEQATDEEQAAVSTFPPAPERPNLAELAQMEPEAAEDEFAALKTPAEGEPTLEEPPAAEVEQLKEAPPAKPSPSRLDQDEMRRRIDETRARLKAKAFDAMVSGETFIETEADKDRKKAQLSEPDIDSDVEKQIDKSFKEDY